MKQGIKFETAFVVFVTLMLLVGAYWGFYHTTEEWIEVTVVGKEAVTHNKKTQYLVFTEDETFECEDSLYHGKFNSSDVYGRIKPGRYRMRVEGWRIPLFSVYRNIIEAQGPLRP